MSATLFELGLVGSFDSLADMRGEDDAIIHSSAGAKETEQKEDTGHGEDDNDSHEGEESTVTAATSYSELKFYSLQLAAVLYHRFGLRAGHTVLLVCRFHVDAEVVAMLAAMRIGAVFVPIDANWLLDEERIASIVSDAEPWMAVVVGSSDQDSAVGTCLAKAGLHRYALVQGDGSLSAAELSAADVPEDVPEVDSRSLSPAQRALLHPAVSGVSSAQTTDNETDLLGDMPMYILYTSGSTGRPKGVIGGQRGFINRIAFQYKHFPYDWGEVVVRRTPAIFVDSLAEIFAPLLTGVPIYACSPSLLEVGSVLDLVRAASEEEEAGVSRLTLLPSQLGMLLDLVSLSELLPQLRCVTVSGEPCTHALVTKFRSQLPECMLVNLYGSTEVAGDVTYAVLCGPDVAEPNCDERELEVPKHSFAPIGCAIENNHLFVVEEEVKSSKEESNEAQRLVFRQVPVGQPGELLVFGCHVANGYYRNPSETSARFLVNPVVFDLEGCVVDFSALSISDSLCFDSDTEAEMVDGVAPGSKSVCSGQASYVLFRMGDIVVCDPVSSALTWLGRRDCQVKVRGVRLELEDAEARIVAALGARPTDLAIVAVSVDSDLTDQNQLVMFVEVKAASRLLNIAKDTVTVDACALLKSKVIDQLPLLYVPGYVHLIEKLPRNVTGKINRKELTSLFTSQYLADNQSSIFKQPSQPKADAPTTQADIASQVVEILLKVLPKLHEVCRLGDTDSMSRLLARSFVELGGDSMTSIVFGWRLREALGIDVPQKDLLGQSLAEIIRNSSSSSPISTARSSPAAKISDGLVPKPVLVQDTLLTCTAARVISRNIDLVDNKSVDSASISSVSFTNLRSCWSHGLLRCVDASPLLVDFGSLSVAFIGSHGGDFTAVDARSGTCIWHIQLGARVEAAAAFILMEQLPIVIVPSYSAIDVEGLANSGRADGLTGTLWGLDARSGAVIWQTGLAGELKSTPVIDAASLTLFIGCYDNYLYCLSSATGRLMGKVDLGGPIYSSPAIDSSSTRLWVATIRGELYCLSWVFREKTALCDLEIIWQVDVSSPVYSALQLTGGLLVFGCVDGSLRVLDAATGVFLASNTSSTRPVFSSPCLVRGLESDSLFAIFGSHDGYLRCVCIDPQLKAPAVERTSQRRVSKSEMKRSRVSPAPPDELPLRWSRHLGAVIFASPALACMNSRSAVVACTTAGFVCAVDVYSGELLCTVGLPAEIFSSPVVSGGSVFVGCRDDKLHCIELH